MPGASQIATGEKNYLSIRIYRDQAGIRWEQENPDFLYFTKHDGPTEVLKPDFDYNTEMAIDGTKPPSGQPEAIMDSMGNIHNEVGRAIGQESYISGKFPGLDEGIGGVDIIHKVVESGANRNVWVSINE